MEFRIWVETRLTGCILERHNVATVERTTAEIAPEEFGLSLEEGKSLIRQVHARIVQTQIDVLGASERACILCNRNQHVKDIRSRCIRTVFGRIEVTCRRYIVWGVEKWGPAPKRGYTVGARCSADTSEPSKNVWWREW